jgi:signal transduction histidine kinase/CheY-like chemotaxis protein/CHASE2 domain-containing sensor protein
VKQTSPGRLPKFLSGTLKSSWRWLPGSIAASLVIFLFELGAWQQFEFIAYRQLFRVRGEQPVDSRIVTISIDDTSLDSLGAFPWPRQRYVDLLSKLQTAQPAVVAFTFPLSDNNNEDVLLATEMQKLTVVLADNWDTRDLPVLSNSRLRSVVAQVGHVQRFEDNDGLVRSIELIKRNQPAFGLAVVRAFQPNASSQQYPADLWLNWRSAAPKIPNYSFAQIVDPNFNANVLTGKILVVGVTAYGIDRMGTPFDRYNSANGLHLQATAIDNLLQHRGLLVVPKWLLLILLVLACPLLSWQLSYYSQGRRLLIVLLASCGCLALAVGGLYLNLLIWVATPLIAIGMTGIGVAFSEKMYIDASIDRQIVQLWRAHQVDLISHQNSPAIAPDLPSFSKVAKLASLAEDFGRAQSARAAITHSLSLGLLAVELDGQIWFCNSVAARLVKTSVGENINRCLVPQWLSRSEWDANLYLLQSGQYIAPKEVQQGEQFFTLRMEPLLDWRILQSGFGTETPEPTSETSISGVLLVVEDITSAKQMQSLILDLEIQRRQELTKQNIALDKARQLAEAAASIKSAFLANMSHEIRTPMNAVVGLTNLLLDTPLNNDQEDFVSTIKVSADHLLKIINEILDFSKLESGEMQLESIEFDLKELIEQVVEILANRAHSKELNLSYWIETHTPRLVKGDPTRLQQILTNLIGNAIKFTDQGGVMVDVRPLFCDSNSTTIKITVTDTGIGISPENQQKLFQSFSQADASTTRQYGGTGLGLAICQRLIDLMGGKIGVDSVSGSGSAFWVEVDLPTLSVPVSMSVPALRGVSLSIFDDWPHRALALTKVVEEWGMRVIKDSNERPQLALIDWSMGTNQELVDLLVEREVPTIVMTTFDRYESARAKLGEKVSYIFKPIKSARLVNLCQELVSPVVRQVAQSIDVSVGNPAVILPPPSPKENRQILLAEDNLINQKVALRQLAKLGYEVDVANNGQEVLEKLTEKPYDLILMDCHMPILDGYETTIMIRRLSDKRRNTVIIALTASAMKSDLEQAIAVGMNDFLSKPVKIEQLQQTIEGWLSDSSQIKSRLLASDL